MYYFFKSSAFIQITILSLHRETTTKLFRLKIKIMGHKAMQQEMNDLSTKLIADKCNSRFDSEIHVKESLIVGFNGLIIDRFYSVKNEKTILSILKEKGYEKCLRKEASAYCAMFQEWNEKTEFWIEWKSVWLKKITN